MNSQTQAISDKFEGVGAEFFIELPCLPLEDMNKAIELSVEIDEQLPSVVSSHICVNEEGEEVSVLLAADELNLSDGAFLDVLQDISVREEIPIVLYTAANRSLRKGFWPEEEDQWIEQVRDLDFWEQHLKTLLSLEQPAETSAGAEPEVPLSQLLEKIQEDFEEIFIELEEPWRENFFSRYMEDASVISLGIGLFERNEREFGISVHIFLEDWDTGEPISIEDAGLTKEAGEGSAIAEVMERLPKVAFSDVQNIVENAEKRDPLEFPKEIAAVFRGEASPFKYCGCKLYWNDELVDA